MLKISVEGFNQSTIEFSLKGHLAGYWAGDFIRLWSNCRSLHRGVCLIDVSGIGEMDQVGEMCIRHLAANGARFRAGGEMAGRIIELVCRERKQALTEGREFTSIIFHGAHYRNCVSGGEPIAEQG
jgi:hypothetical protein